MAAATARSRVLILVTGSTAEFSCVCGLLLLGDSVPSPGSGKGGQGKGLAIAHLSPFGNFSLLSGIPVIA